MKFFAIIFLTMFFSCDNKINKARKTANGNIVEGYFDKNGLLNGKAIYYSISGIKIASATYSQGVLEGDSVSFFQNGRIKDSMTFSHGLLNGNICSYDSFGNVIIKENYYFGLYCGDNSFYYRGKIAEYLLHSFDKKELINCKYDSNERCRYFYFDAKPVIRKGYSLGDSAWNLLLYFPHPPDFKINYDFEIVNANTSIVKKIKLDDNRIFLDTLLRIQSNQELYFLSITYKSLSNDSSINVFHSKW